MELDILQPLIDIGGIAALIGVSYLVISSRTKRKHFAFDFSGSSGNLIDEKNNTYKWTFSGTIKNRSEVPNTISQIYMVVWKNNKRNSWLRMGHGLTIKDTNSKSNLQCPIYFLPREAKKVELEYTQNIDPNSADGRILRDMEEVIPGRGFYLHKRWYELLFEDVDKNYFDQNGNLINRQEADLWFTLGNSYRQLDDVKLLPIVNHFFKIILSKIIFALHRVFWHLGLA